ncbi:hypothetical protein [Aeromonas dhakensis]|uniref:hypothetical protein n=1 Tax=Aeromonas dhakensis TaxID=196024 RepID=UPI00357139FE
MSQTKTRALVEGGQLRRAVAGELQHLEAPRSWMGTESANIFQLLLQLMNVVEQLAAATASHTQGSGPVPGNSGAMTGHGQQAKQLAGQLSPIIE